MKCLLNSVAGYAISYTPPSFYFEITWNGLCVGPGERGRTRAALTMCQLKV